MRQEYYFRLVKYESGLMKCYYINHDGEWKVTGINVPEDLEKRGLKVNVEEIAEKDHKESIKNDQPKRVRDTRTSGKKKKAKS